MAVNIRLRFKRIKTMFPNGNIDIASCFILQYYTKITNTDA